MNASSICFPQRRREGPPRGRGVERVCEAASQQIHNHILPISRYLETKEQRRLEESLSGGFAGTVSQAGLCRRQRQVSAARRKEYRPDDNAAHGKRRDGQVTCRRPEDQRGRSGRPWTLGRGQLAGDLEGRRRKPLTGELLDESDVK